MIWYEEEVQRVEQERNKLGYNPRILFYGSSSFRQWANLYEDFKEYQPVNLGFGGSTLAACTWFFKRIVSGYNPEMILLYAGDNDIGDGRNPEEIFLFYKLLNIKLKEQFGDIKLGFVSIKPSIIRWGLIDKIKHTNKLIREDIEKQANHYYINIYDRMIDHHGNPKLTYFEPDGLHLNAKGYALWKEVIGAFILNTL